MTTLGHSSLIICPFFSEKEVRKCFQNLNLMNLLFQILEITPKYSLNKVQQFIRICMQLTYSKTKPKNSWISKGSYEGEVERLWSTTNQHEQNLDNKNLLYLWPVRPSSNQKGYSKEKVRAGFEHWKSSVSPDALYQTRLSTYYNYCICLKGY